MSQDTSHPTNLFARISERIERTADKYVHFPFESHQRRHNCLFIHIPKTAGTSVRAAMGTHRVYQRQHFPWFVYRAANRKYFDHAFKFSFVRNPFDRLYSAYEYLKAGGAGGARDQAAGQVIRGYQDFDDFIYRALHEGELRSNLHLLPQSTFIADLCGKVVVDFVGRQETLDQDFALIAQKLGIAYKAERKNVNRDKHHQDYRSAYKSTRSVEIVENLYIQDLKLFNYSFE